MSALQHKANLRVVLHFYTRMHIIYPLNLQSFVNHFGQITLWCYYHICSLPQD